MKAKKILSLFLSFVLVLACIPVAMASTGPTLLITADKEYVESDALVEYTVTLQNADQLHNEELGYHGVWNVTFTLDLPGGLEFLYGDVDPSFDEITKYTNTVFNETSLVFTSFGALSEGYTGGDVVCMTFTCRVTGEVGGKLTANLKDTDLSDGYNSHEANVVTATVELHEHTEEVIPGKEPTCTEPGLTEGVWCPICGEILVEQEEIPVTEHTDENGDYVCDDCGEDLCTEHVEEVVPGKEPTCTETGLTEGKKCANCGEILVKQETITALGHNYDNGVVTTAPTCEEAGVMTYTCQNDSSHSYTERISALGHSYDGGVVTKEPTCEEAGVKTYTCQNDSSHSYTEMIAALDHSYDDGVVTKEPTCTEDGVMTYTCLNDPSHSYTKAIPADGHTDENGDYICDDCGENLCVDHTEEVIPGKEPTCTETGLTEGKKCSICGEILVKQEEIPAKGHTEEIVPGKAPTCTETGLTEGKKCSVCGLTLVEQEVIPALGHSYDDGVVTKESTCTEAGVKTYTCQNGCGDSYTETIPALGHNYDDGVVTTAPSCGVPGVMTYTCLNGCGDSYTVEIPALEHDWVYHSETETEYIFVCANCGEMISYEKDGTIEVSVLPDGTVIITKTYEDGTVIIETRYPNGVRSIVTKGAEGELISIVVVIYAAVSYEAVRTDTPVLLPITHLFEEYGADMRFTILTNCEKDVPVEIPVANVQPNHVVIILGDEDVETIVPTTKMPEIGVGFDCVDGTFLKIGTNPVSFSDIQGTNWYNLAVEFVSARGIMTGMTANTFEAAGTTTRAQVWTMLARLSGVDTTSTEGNWYDVARAWAMENGISDGTYADGKITRQEMVTMLYRFVEGKGDSKSIEGFSDADLVSSWAKDAMEWAYGMGIMQGDGNGLNPTGNATRAEMAQFFMNFIQNI